MKRFFLFVCFASFAACSARPPERPRFVKTGAPAPKLALKKLINAPRSELRGWEDLAGSAVVLEFGASWCEPWVDALPLRNQLEERFRGRPVVFIYVTDESEADVRAFMRKHPVNGWVAPEAGADLFKAFRVFGRPYVVLVDRDGTVAAIPKYDEVKAEGLMRLLAGHYPTDAAPAVSSGLPSALAEFYISRSAAPGGTAQYGPASLRASGMSLEYALEYVFGRVDKFEIGPGAGGAMAAAYDIRFSLPAERAEMKKDFFLKNLESALGLRAVRVEREAEVYVLKTEPGGPLNVKKTLGYRGVELEGAVLKVRGGSFLSVAARVREILREPVLDETASPGPFEYSLELDSADAGTIAAQLKKQLGLRLARLRRRITVVEVSRVITPRPIQ